jgi:o-succinylbenzoate---CoA ligase
VNSPRSWRLEPLPKAAGPWAWQLPGVGGALRWLHDHLLGDGCRVALISAPNPATVALLQAASLANIDLILCHERLPAHLLEQQIADANVAAVIADRPWPRSLQMPESFANEAVHQFGDGGALIMHTSGTTGFPRRVRLPWSRVLAGSVAAARWLQLAPTETWLAGLPIDHMGGTALIFRAACSGTPIELRTKIDIEELSEALFAQTIQAASVVPTHVQRLLKQKRSWPANHRLIVGGGPLAPPLARAARAAGLILHTTYGMTETGAMVACQRPGDDDPSAGCPLIPGWTVRILEPDADGVGRIQVRGPGRSSGYESSGRPPATPQDWLTTGDCGRLVNGRLDHIERADYVIISGGEKIAPSAVEAVLATHPAIADVAVSGRADPEWGDVVVAWVVYAGTPPSDDEMHAWCQANLPPHQRPRSWVTMSELPRSALGKLQRRLLTKPGA